MWDNAVFIYVCMNACMYEYVCVFCVCVEGGGIWYDANISPCDFQISAWLKLKQAPKEHDKTYIRVMSAQLDIYS